MRQFRTQAIVLNRTNYGEADRIIGFLTPGHGKIKAIAKGVRKQKSKLAGGIELFSVSDISFIPGRREISTVVSTRLIKHYGHIVKDLDRTAVAYDAIKTLDKATEDQPEEAYFHLLEQAFNALDDDTVSPELTRAWFDAQLLRLGGHTPNLRTEPGGKKLQPGQAYDFDFENMIFYPGKAYDTGQIKFLRLLFSPNSPKAIQKVKGTAQLAAQLQAPLRLMLQNYVRL